MTRVEAPRGATEVLAALIAMAREHADPERALAMVRALRQAHGLSLDLVWEQDRLSGAYHYDALLSEPGLGTLSLALCPEGATPWPLRGVLSVREQDVLRVDGQTLSLAQVMRLVDVLWDDADVLRGLVDVCLVRDAMRRRDIQVDAEHLQSALDAFRLQQGLLTEEATQRWMTARGLTHVELEEMLEGDAAERVLRDRVVDDRRLDDLWRRGAAGFDVARLARLRLPSEEVASGLARAIGRGEMGFYDALERALLAGEAIRVPGHAWGSWRRRDLPADYAEAVFAARPGDVVGPLPAPDGHDLVRVVDLLRADRGDPATAEAIHEAAFREWLDERRGEATIEWLWGTTEQTDAATGAAGQAST